MLVTKKAEQAAVFARLRQVNMKLKYDLRRAGLYVYFDGELDDCSGGRVKRELDDLLDEYPSVKSVVFNMKNLSFMDSTGIGILIGRYKRLKKKGISLYIENPSFVADKVFQVGGIYGLIPKI